MYMFPGAPPPHFESKLNRHIVVQHAQYSTCSLIPRPPPFFVLWFAFSKPKNKKQGKDWERGPAQLSVTCSTGEPGNEALPSFLLLAVRGEPGNEANFFVLYYKHLLVF